MLAVVINAPMPNRPAARFTTDRYVDYCGGRKVIRLIEYSDGWAFAKIDLAKPGPGAEWFGTIQTVTGALPDVVENLRRYKQRDQFGY